MMEVDGAEGEGASRGAEEVTGCSDRDRLTAELEFVQLLANPQYLLYLAQNKYFADDAFINYLRYLTYWREPQYAKLVIFPQCLFFLDQLQRKEFRDLLVNGTFIEWLHQQQYYFWCTHREDKPAGLTAKAEDAPPPQAN